MLKMTPDPSVQRIIVQVTTDYPALLDPIKKYINYLQSTINQQTNLALYIEIIENGLIYIYRDLESFKKLNRPYKPMVENPDIRLRSPETVQKLRSKDLFFLQNVPLEFNFPIQGIQVIFTTITGPKDVINAHYEQFFSEIKDDGLKLIKKDSNTLIAHFSSYSAIVDYLKAVQSLFPNL
jgi:hypothetical protein